MPCSRFQGSKTVQEDIIRQPVQLIDEDLDVVAGGSISVSLHDINIVDVDQIIRQVQVGGIRTDQSAVNVSSVRQLS